jgi:hypothetical protein
MRTISVIGVIVLSLAMVPHLQAASGCNQSAQKGEAEGGAGGNWQQTPGQKAEAEGGAGGNWQQSPDAAQSAQANAGGTRVASAEPCK